MRPAEKFCRVAPMDAATRTTRTGVSSQRPRPVGARRIETCIQPARASIAGGHTQFRVETVASCGQQAKRPTPVAVMAIAGMDVQRWGWLVIRSDRTRIIAHPAPNATSAE